MVDGEGAPALTFGWQLFRHPSVPQAQGVTESPLWSTNPWRSGTAVSQLDAHLSLTSLAALPSVSGSVRHFTFSSISLCQFAFNLDFLFFCSISTSMLSAFFCSIINSTKGAVTSTDASYRRPHWINDSQPTIFAGERQQLPFFVCYSLPACNGRNELVSEYFLN